MNKIISGALFFYDMKRRATQDRPCLENPRENESKILTAVSEKRIVLLDHQAAENSGVQVNKNYTNRCQYSVIVLVVASVIQHDLRHIED